MSPTFLSQIIQKSWLNRGLLSYGLLPFSKLAECFAKKKRRSYLNGQAYKAPVPVIVVGNIFVGGTGKTPLTMALVNALKSKGYTPGIISRGYGVNLGHQARFADLSSIPHRLPEHATAQSLSQFIGDEPALLARLAPIAVQPKRSKAVECLLAHCPAVNVIISDDGLQHYALARDIEIVVQDSRGVGNGLMLPAGPLREPVSRLASVDFIVTNDPTSFECTEIPPFPADIPTPSINMRLALIAFEHLHSGQRLSLSDFLTQYRQTPITAIAGIGHPQRFFQDLEHMGLHLAHRHAFADHHRFTLADLIPYSDNPVIMTSKDAIKCQAFAQKNWWVAHAQAQFKPDNFFDLIHQKLSLLSR